MRTQLPHSDVIVFTSAVWDTTCTAVRGGEEVLVIDSPVFPEELEAVPSLLGEHGFPTERLRLFNTHGDWDHILGPLMFPSAPVWCGRSTADRLAADPAELDQMMTTFDQMFYVDRPQPLSLDNLEPLEVPGEVRLDGERVGLIQADGHTVDGTAAWFPNMKLLAAGDYLSPVELPRLRGGIEAHLDTLDRLQPTVEQAELVIPGHGHPMTSEEALAVLAEDRRYLTELRDKGSNAKLPPGRDDGEQHRIHTDMNVPAVEGRAAKGAAGGNLPG